MENILDNFVKFLDDEKFSYQRSKSENSLMLFLRLKHGDFRVQCKYWSDRSYFICHCISPVKIPAVKIPNVLEFIARVNDQTLIGNLEFDFHINAVLSRVGIDLEHITLLSNNFFHSILLPVTYLMDNFHEGLLSIVYSNANPEEVLKQINKGLPIVIPQLCNN